MDSDLPRPPRQYKFKPILPSQRKGKEAVQLKKQEGDKGAEAKNKKVLQQMSELGTFKRQRRSTIRTESKSTVQAAFIHGPKRSTAYQSSPQDGSHGDSSGSEFKHTGDGSEQFDVDTDVGFLIDFQDYPPIILPLRRPGSGDPDILDEAEFGEAATTREYDESKINHAAELGLNPAEASEKPRMIFFQLPKSFPSIKRSASEGTSERSCSFEEWPAGYMGKLQVYKSGAVKLKLGDTLFDVTAGSNSTFQETMVAINTEENNSTFQETVVAINTKENHCCAVGDLVHRHAVISPDIDHALNSENDLGWVEEGTLAVMDLKTRQKLV